MVARRSVLLLTLLLAASAQGRRGRFHKGSGSTPRPPGYDGVDCKKCMTFVMRLLTPAARGCADGNGTVVPSSTPLRVPTAFCDTLLPKKRQPIVYSFGVDNVWDFDKTMAIRGCEVVSFDPFCCGGSRKISEAQDFVPVGLAAYDGMAFSDDPHRPNVSYPVLTLKTIMEGYGHPKVDVLRMKVSTNKEWKGLKNLINTGALEDVRQISMNMHMRDPEMWSEYKLILGGIKKARRNSPRATLAARRGCAASLGHGRARRSALARAGLGYQGTWEALVERGPPGDMQASALPLLPSSEALLTHDMHAAGRFLPVLRGETAGRRVPQDSGGLVGALLGLRGQLRLRLLVTV